MPEVTKLKVISSGLGDDSSTVTLVDLNCSSSAITSSSDEIDTFKLAAGSANQLS